jgi:hypothetical protein
MEDQAHQAGPTAGPDHERRWAELADLVLIIGREIQFRGYTDERDADPGDGRGVTVHTTDQGRTNYALVRREWATAVAAAVGYDTTNLDAALALLTAMENGLTTSRPQNRAKRTATQN